MKAWQKITVALLLLASMACAALSAGGSQSMAALSPQEAEQEEPQAEAYPASLRDEPEPAPAPLSAPGAPGPVCTLRRELEAELLAGGRVTLAAGSPCYLIQAFSDSDHHLLSTESGRFYAPAIAVDTSGCNVAYQFSEDQDMRITTGFSGEALERCLSGGLSGLGEAFARAESAYGVNALFMIAICQHESGNGNSGLATSQNNLIGLRSGSGWASFGSMSECVDYLGDYLADYYLSPGCPFYHGSTISGVSVTYCGGSGEWINHIGNYMRQDLALIQGQ